MGWEIVLFVTLAVLLVGLLVWMRRQESRYLKSRTRDALSPSLQEEIEKEREEGLRHRQLFEEALKKAKARGE